MSDIAAPIRNIGQASVGQITATSARIKNRLAIRVMRIRGVQSRGRRR